MLRITLSSLILLAGVLAGGPEGGWARPAVAAAQAAPPPCQQALTSGDSTVTLSSGGRLRSALVHVPDAPAGAALPLLLALHGAAQNGGFFAGYTGFSVVANAERFIAVYPNATELNGHSYWSINDHWAGTADDVQFISDLLDELQATLCVDRSRVWATGVSNGAGMVARLACELSSRVVAIAPVAGGYGSQPPCHPRAQVSVLELHGTSDPVVPYRGGPGRMGAVLPFVQAWADRDGCRGPPQTARFAARVVRYRWQHCAPGIGVEHLGIVGGAHQLPGAAPPDGGQASTIGAAWVIWRFLRGCTRR